LSEREVMSAEELEGLQLFRPGESPNGVELWAPVVTPSGDVQGNYMVSTLGRVVRIAGGCGTRPGTILRTPPSRDGYPTVCLTRGGICKTWNVHKLVASTFLGRPPEDMYGQFHAHHKSLVRSDNRAVNLEWTSAEENLSSWWHKHMGGR